MSRQELRRRLLLADPTARDEDLTYGPETHDEDDATDEEETAAAEDGREA